MNNKVDIGRRCLKFSWQIIKITRTLPVDLASRILIRETIRSACSIGANVVEGGAGHSRKEFINFLTIARKSAIETNYWLQLLKLSYPEKDEINNLLGNNNQIGKIITTIIKNSKKDIIN